MAYWGTSISRMMSGVGCTMGHLLAFVF